MFLNKLLSKSLVVLLLSLLILSLPTNSIAQTVDPLSTFDFSQIQIPNFDTSQFFNQDTGLPTGLEEQLSISVLPSIPKPGQQVNISVTSFSSDMNKAVFTWIVNGEERVSQRGYREFSFTAPKAGEVTTIGVVIQKEDGGTLTRSFTFAPAEVDIIYEANTYTPPLYEGKALFTSESNVVFHAIPKFSQNGVTIPPSRLVYIWKVNEKVIEEASGYGKSSYSYQGSLIQRPSKVSVEVSAVNSPLQAKGSLTIANQNPEILIYEDNPLIGKVFEKTVDGTFMLNRDEIELFAEPYFFSVNSPDDGLVNLSWRLNGYEIPLEPNTNSLIFRNTDDKAGISGISLFVQHAYNILQSSTKSLSLEFDPSTTETFNNNQNEDFVF